MQLAIGVFLVGNYATDERYFGLWEINGDWGRNNGWCGKPTAQGTDLDFDRLTGIRGNGAWGGIDPGGVPSPTRGFSVLQSKFILPNIQ